MHVLEAKKFNFVAVSFAFKYMLNFMFFFLFFLSFYDSFNFAYLCFSPNYVDILICKYIYTHMQEKINCDLTVFLSPL